MNEAVCTINLTRSVAVRLTAYGTVLFFVALGFVVSLSGSEVHNLGPNRALIVTGLSAILASVAIIAVHELVHGFFFWIFGGKPKYGVGLFAWFCPCAYAVAPGVPFTLVQMTVICLAPLVLLSAASLGLMWLAPALSTAAAVAFVTNFSGAIGDLWIVRQIWRFHGCRDLTMTDSMEGLHIHTPDPGAARVADRLAASARGGVTSRLVLRWIAATLLILITVTPLTIGMSLLGAQNVTIGPPQFPLLVFKEVPGDRLTLSVDLNAMMAAGLVFALLSLLFDRRTATTRSGTAPDGSPHPAFF